MEITLYSDSFYIPISDNEMVDDIEWHGRKVEVSDQMHMLNCIKDALQSAFHAYRPLPCGGKVGGSASGKVEADGSSNAKAEGHISYEDKDGNKVKAEADVEVNRDNNGNSSSSASVKISYEKEFVM